VKSPEFSSFSKCLVSVLNCFAVFASHPLFHSFQFFPKDQKYIALFAGNEDEEIQRKRQEMRERVKANIAAAKAAQIDLEGKLLGCNNPFSFCFS
jgi:hypothetical protein